jgi:CBS-domain-containing membrane protein
LRINLAGTDVADPMRAHREVHMKAAIAHEPLLVRDVMTQAIVFLRTTQTLEQAWDAFHQHSVNGAPVLSPGGRLVGMVTTSDLADPRRRRALEPCTVGDVMTKVIYAVRADDGVELATRLMIDQDIHRAVAVNDDGSIAGIVSPLDILRGLLRHEASGDDRDGLRLKYVDLREMP